MFQFAINVQWRYKTVINAIRKFADNTFLCSVVNSAIFKSPSANSLVASPSPQNFEVTSPSPLLSRVVTNMVADYSAFTNL